MRTRNKEEGEKQVEEIYRENEQKKKKHYVKYRKATKKWRHGLPMVITTFAAAFLTFLMAGYAKAQNQENVGMFLWITFGLCVAGLIIKAIASSEAYAGIKSKENETIVLTDDSLIYSYSTKFNPEDYGHSCTIIKDFSLTDIKKVTYDTEHRACIVHGMAVYVGAENVTTYLNSKSDTDSNKKRRNKREKCELIIFDYYDNIERLQERLQSFTRKKGEEYGKKTFDG